MTTRPQHPPYTGELRTVGKLLDEMFAKMNKINATVVHAREEAVSQAENAGKLQDRDAARRDANGKKGRE